MQMQCGLSSGDGARAFARVLSLSRPVPVRANVMQLQVRRSRGFAGADIEEKFEGDKLRRRNQERSGR